MVRLGASGGEELFFLRVKNRIIRLVQYLRESDDPNDCADNTLRLDILTYALIAQCEFKIICTKGAPMIQIIKINYIINYIIKWAINYVYVIYVCLCCLCLFVISPTERLHLTAKSTYSHIV